MKKLFVIPLSIFIIHLTACKSKVKDANNSGEETGTRQETSKPAGSPAGQSKTYTVTFTPDTLYLGKSKEAFIKLKNAKAIALSDPDGKETGIEFSYEFDATNKNKMGTAGIYVNPGDFRMTLDNGNNIVQDNYNAVSADPESTKTSTGNIFKIPVGTKPKSLNLFYDQTRSAVTIDLK